ncbi:hypothetical protein DSO57_1032974 [Entomophthora muscae]|uniref:Uncharacterized protein n=1 Tax=Entomophthora muscae TaxID=34485 RepID=A0ACC2S249_9FUNG|nr:hypothetical protein DSO57_1032974 [Entomophthora muscae]
MPEIPHSSKDSFLKEKILKELAPNSFSKNTGPSDSTSLKSKSDGALSGMPIPRTGLKPKAKKGLVAGIIVVPPDII